jgi:RimJ/RimL family protein N-acetyltransferase
MDIDFRKGTLNDLDRVTAKIHEFAPRMLRSVGADDEQIDEWLTFYASRNRWRKRLDSDKASVFIAERDGLVLGVGYVQLYPDLDNVLAARFGGLYIRYPRQGIGTAIMRERIKEAKRMGADYIKLEAAEQNEAMRKLAERYKFQPHERYQHQIISHVPFLKYRRALSEDGEDFLLDVG